MRQLINYHIWESEQLLRVMLEKSQETGMNIETFSVVVDASGWTLSQATREAYFFIKGVLLLCILRYCYYQFTATFNRYTYYYNHHYYYFRDH